LGDRRHNAEESDLALARNQEFERQLASLASIIAKCVIDPEVIVVIAERRRDVSTRDPDAQYPGPEKSDVRSALEIRPLVPVLYLRGGGNKDLINVQLNTYILARNRRLAPRYFAKFNEQGTWLYFIRPVSRLPDVFALTVHSEISQKIQGVDKDTPPHDFAKSFGLDSWLRRDNWFELAEPRSAVFISPEIRELQPIHQYDQVYTDQLNSRVQKTLALREQRGSLNEILMLTDEQVEEIKRLVEMFPSDGKVPNVDDLLAMKSPFADAILRELSRKPMEELDSNLRVLKESIPESFQSTTEPI